MALGRRSGCAPTNSNRNIVREYGVGQLAKMTGVWVGGRFLMLNRDKPYPARKGFVSNRRTRQITDSESISILVASVVAAI
jgi:hypothetical protein